MHLHRQINRSIVVHLSRYSTGRRFLFLDKAAYGVGASDEEKIQSSYERLKEQAKIEAADKWGAVLEEVSSSLNIEEKEITGSSISSFLAKEFGEQANNAKLSPKTFFILDKFAEQHPSELNKLYKGDKMKLENGLLTITRKNGKMIEVDLKVGIIPRAKPKNKADKQMSENQKIEPKSKNIKIPSSGNLDSVNVVLTEEKTDNQVGETVDNDLLGGDNRESRDEIVVVKSNKKTKEEPLKAYTVEAAKEKAYEFLGIKSNTDSNSAIKRFAKGAIDAILEVPEMIEKLFTDPKKFLSETWSQMKAFYKKLKDDTWNTIKEIGASLWDMASFYGMGQIVAGFLLPGLLILKVARRIPGLKQVIPARKKMKVKGENYKIGDKVEYENKKGEIKEMYVVGPSKDGGLMLRRSPIEGGFIRKGMRTPHGWKKQSDFSISEKEMGQVMKVDTKPGKILSTLNKMTSYSGQKLRSAASGIIENLNTLGRKITQGKQLPENLNKMLFEMGIVVSRIKDISIRKSLIDKISEVREKMKQRQKEWGNKKEKSIDMYEVGDDIKIIGNDNKIIDAKIIGQNSDGSFKVEYGPDWHKKQRSVGSEELKIANTKIFQEKKLSNGNGRMLSEAEMKQGILLEFGGGDISIVPKKSFGLDGDGFVIFESSNKPVVKSGKISGNYILKEPGENIQLGRSSDSSIKFKSLKNEEVSRKHAYVSFNKDGGIFIQDLKSTKGTTYHFYGNLRYVPNNKRNADYKTLDKLWPKGLGGQIKQGGSGDCYFLAALESVKQHPIGKRILAETIHEKPDGSWSVKFKGSSRELIIKKAEVHEMKKASKLLKGSLGDQILERAYARLIHQRKNDFRKKGRSGDTVVISGKGDMAFEGGQSHQSFKDLFGSEIKKSHSRSSEAHKIFSSAKDNQIFAAGTISPANILKRKDLKDIVSTKEYQAYRNNPNMKADRLTYKVKDINGRSRDIHCSHAYSIGEINKSKEWVEIVNPHDTLNGKIKLSFDEFADKFRSIYMGEIQLPTPVQLQKAA